MQTLADRDDLDRTAEDGYTPQSTVDTGVHDLGDLWLDIGGSD